MAKAIFVRNMGTLENSLGSIPIGFNEDTSVAHYLITVEAFGNGGNPATGNNSVPSYNKDTHKKATDVEARAKHHKSLRQ